MHSSLCIEFVELRNVQLNEDKARPKRPMAWHEMDGWWSDGADVAHGFTL